MTQALSQTRIQIESDRYDLVIGDGSRIEFSPAGITYVGKDGATFSTPAGAGFRYQAPDRPNRVPADGVTPSRLVVHPPADGNPPA